MRSNRPRHGRTTASLLAALAVVAGVAPTTPLDLARAEASSSYSAPIVSDGQVAVRYSQPYGSPANDAVVSTTRYSLVYNLVTAGAAHLSVPGRANLLATDSLSLSPAVKLAREWYRAAPEFRLAPGATMTPPSGTPQSFLVPAIYTVVAENGFTTKAWRVMITKQR